MLDPTTTPTTADVLTAIRNGRIYAMPDPTEPVARQLHTPPVLPEPPLLCRLGLHDLRPISVTGHRPAGAIDLCTTTSTCRRPHCALLRHEQNRTPPGRRTATLASAALIGARTGLHTLRTRLAGR